MSDEHRLQRTVGEESAGRVRRIIDGEIVKFGGVEFEPAEKWR